MTKSHRGNRILQLMLGFAVAGGATASAADPLIVSTVEGLPGNDAVGLSTQDQRRPVIAAGGAGVLVVWEDTRTVLTGFTQTPFEPLLGNLQDLVAARLDGDGNVLDAAPILVTNRGRNQQQPEVAWNEAADAWLVTWMSQRPDWHFFDDIMAARVAADGTVLDADPIPLRLERNDPANDHGLTPAVISNGSEWLVVWQDVTWSGFEGRPTVSGLRIGADGVPVGSPVVLHQHPDLAFGPREPRVAYSNGVYLVTWLEAGSNQVRAARFDGALTPLDGTPISVASGFWARVAGRDDGFMVVTSDHRAYRVTTAGAVLDPAGIDVAAGYPFGITGPDVAFDGSEYLVVWALDGTVWGRRLASDATPLDPQPIALVTGDNAQAAYVGAVPGTFLVGWLHLFSGDLQTFKIMPVAAGDLSSTGPQAVVGSNYSTRARIGALGGRFLTLWQRQPTHDAGPSDAYAAFVETDGTATGSFSVDGVGAAADIELAIGPDRALAVWADGVGHDGLAIEGRLIGADGSLPGGELVIADAVNGQRFPAAAWDGANFVVAWTDYRSLYRCQAQRNAITVASRCFDVELLWGESNVTSWAPPRTTQKNVGAGTPFRAAGGTPCRPQKGRAHDLHPAHRQHHQDHDGHRWSLGPARQTRCRAGRAGRQRHRVGVGGRQLVRRHLHHRRRHRRSDNGPRRDPLAAAVECRPDRSGARLRPAQRRADPGRSRAGRARRPAADGRAARRRPFRARKRQPSPAPARPAQCRSQRGRR